MNNPISFQTPNSEASIKLSSTLRTAFASLFNLFMISALLLYCIISIYLLLNRGWLSTFQWLLLIFCVLFLFLYLWSILTRSIEVNNENIRYKEAFREVVIKWGELDSIHIERLKGQINLRIHGKTTRIHTYGLDKKMLPTLNDVMTHQAEAHDIPIQIDLI